MPGGPIHAEYFPILYSEAERYQVVATSFPMEFALFMQMMARQRRIVSRLANDHQLIRVEQEILAQLGAFVALRQGRLNKLLARRARGSAA